MALQITLTEQQWVVIISFDQSLVESLTNWLNWCAYYHQEYFMNIISTQTTQQSLDKQTTQEVIKRKQQQQQQLSSLTNELK